MPTTSKITADIADPKHGATLTELGRFVQEALRAGADGDEKATVVTNLRSGVKRLEITVRAEAKIDG